MKSKNFLSKLCRLSRASQYCDVSVDRRLTVGSPSGLHRLTKYIAVMFLLLVVGVGNVWGADETVTWSVSTSTANTISKDSGTLPTGASASMSSNDSQSDKSQLTNGKKQTFTLTGMDGCTIKGVTINMRKSSKGSSATVTVKVGSTTLQSGQTISLSTTAADKTVTLANTTTVVGTSENVVITVTANKNSAYVLKYKVTYEAGGGGTPTCETPTFSPAAGSYIGTQSVTISSGTSGSTIYYTTNGSTPTTSSSSGSAGAASATVSVSSSQTLKAYAVKDGANDSEVATAAYTIVSCANDDFDWNLATNSYTTGPGEEVTWSGTYATMHNEGTNATNYLGGDANSRTSSRFYNGNALTITPASGVTISHVVFTATTDGYATALRNSTWTNAAASGSGSYVIVTPTDGTSAFSAAVGGTCGFTNVNVCYSAASCGSTPTVSAGSLKGSVSASSSATAQCTGGITNIGGAGCSLTSYGFAVGTASGPTIGGTLTSGGKTYEVGSSIAASTGFEKLIDGLAASTTYYARPYATNGAGTGYGTQFSFTTLAACTAAPTVGAGSNSDVTKNSATVTCSAGITSLGTGGCTIESYGFVYGTSANPTISNTKKEVGTTYTSTGVSFNTSLTGLTEGQTYYVRPYATNGSGTAYGAQTSFGTPKITVDPVSQVLAFGDRKVGGSYTMTFTVSGVNLQGNIAITPSSGCSGLFAVDKTSITPTNGTVTNEVITVTYTPTTAGTHSDIGTIYINITSTNATSRSMAPSGTGKWEVTWKANGVTQETTLVANNTAPTLPGNPSSCDATSTTFIGWTKTAWTGKQNQAYVDALTTDATKVHTSNSTMSNITANGTVYHAVFAKATGGAGTVHTLTKSNTSWSGYTSSTQDDNQSATWSYYAGGVNNSGTYYWALNTNENNYNIGSPKFSQNVTAISIWVKNAAASARNVYICSSNETAQPTSGDLGSKSIPGSGEEEYSIDNLTGSFDQFYIYVSAALNIKYVKVTVGGTTYSDYMTTCCDKNISWSAPTITGTGATITFNKTSPVATCAGTTTIQATLTLTAGYQATALSFSGGSVSVSPAISLPVNSTTTYTLTFAANTNATLTTTATIAAKPLSSISLSPTSGTVYVGQYAEFAITYDPTDILTKGTTLDGTPSYCVTTGTTNTTLKITGGKAGASITEDKTETVTIKASADNTKKASVSITVKPLPYVSFVDNIHNKTDFGGLTDGKVTATIVANALVKTQKTPTHADLAEPATGNDCEKSHLHLIGWIESTWADEHPAATKSDIIAATAYFYAPNADIDVDAQKGKTYLAVWSTIE